MKIAVHWFRRDLRVTDNTALMAAVRQAEIVYPIFVFDENILQEPDLGAARLTFLLQSLGVLEHNLQSLGYPLTLRRGQPEVEVVKFCRQIKAEAVFCNRDYEPYCQQRDARVFNALNAARIGFELLKDAVIWEEREIATQNDQPYTVYTPYAKAWRARVVPGPYRRLSAANKKISPAPSLAMPGSSAKLGHALAQKIFSGGEDAALAVLRQFMENQVLAYGCQRDFPGLDATSHLSPHLHFGTINVRTIVASLNRAIAQASLEQRQSAAVFLNELIWREFYLQILANYPRVAKGNYHAQYDILEWSDSRDHFQAWCQGQTGYPIVDAAMRCLNATGWMHNRNRMIVAMFLAKDLLLPWSWGERYFLQQLVDGDLAANNGGWQWCAGTGTDAAPYFRIFNPAAQGQKFDPAGDFVRRWIPELAALKGTDIHEPWLAPAHLRKGYPHRIVDHAIQRKLCLARFQKCRGSQARATNFIGPNEL